MKSFARDSNRCSNLWVSTSTGLSSSHNKRSEFNFTLATGSSLTSCNQSKSAFSAFIRLRLRVILFRVAAYLPKQFDSLFGFLRHVLLNGRHRGARGRRRGNASEQRRRRQHVGIVIGVKRREVQIAQLERAIALADQPLPLQISLGFSRHHV